MITKTVKDIHDFFLQEIQDGKRRNLMDFLNTVPGFSSTGSDGLDRMNVTLGMEYYRICEKMADDAILMRIKSNPIMNIASEYLSVHSVNFDDPQAFNDELEYGKYDFKYRGFTYTYNCFKESVAPIVGVNKNGDDDIGTAYYIGDNRFATAGHCVTELDSFKLLKPDKTPYKLKEVWFAPNQNIDDYDLAILVAEEEPVCRSLWLGDPAVLDEVLVMGYPPVPGLNTVLTAETASVATYDKIQCKAVVGQDVAEASTYFNQLDYFLINARVKGGNSGGPVINNVGRVIGTVVQIPFDSEGGFNGKRFDIMGFGICLPSKYTEEILNNHDVRGLFIEGDGYKVMKDSKSLPI